MAAKRGRGMEKGRGGEQGVQVLQQKFFLYSTKYFILYLSMRQRKFFPLRQQQLLLIYVPFGESRLSLCALTPDPWAAGSILFFFKSLNGHGTYL